MKILYEKVGFHFTKKGKCTICGIYCIRKEEFYQTINPWNQKTKEEILIEEREKKNEWLRLPITHFKCQKGENKT